MKTLGLCIGASNISMVLLERETETGRVKVLETSSMPHEGNPRGALKSLVDGELLRSVDRVALTGRKLRSMLKASSISEPEAVEFACGFLRESHPEVDVIVSAGGETFLAYQLDPRGRIINVFTGNKCASGTGEFFLQQIKRMDLGIEEALAGCDLASPYKVAGRCSVFCKSDCTHALNKGASKGRVAAGLCEMMAVKVIELLKKTTHKNVMVVGGASANSAMIHFLRETVPGLVIPEHARYFEALGAALWALDNQTMPVAGLEQLFDEGESSFSFLPPLRDHLSKVTFKEGIRQRAEEGDVCIVGLDVGSTTTKAVVMRVSDNAILASCYLRTGGDPVRASRNCYREVGRQLTAGVKITGLGVTGSGRQIAGLHALTPAVINEIIAHAAAAVYFDPAVDTIFEIGGQDAKYTYITSGVASDYAMNEACSAGTGSFLEEAARESLDIETEEIGDIAMQSGRPLNFSDQCAAFISSDIKSAIQEGAGIEDLAAGLVYSICLNYSNRVKGNRAMGRKVFMQGGVCYNQAVPVAMAALTGKDIIVPPDPGLMGAFGVALEVKNKMALGLLQSREFDLKELAEREVAYEKPFTCAGGREKCDRKCVINMIRIKGRKYPFGGACNKYYNLIHDRRQFDTDKLDLVKQRERMVFHKYALDRVITPVLPPNRKKVAINSSLQANTLFPLYYNFFKALGFEVIYSRQVDADGMERRGAEFCYPVEISHGALMDLIKQDPDVYFLPHVASLNIINSNTVGVTCPFVQAEPYYLQAAFGELRDKQVFRPVLKLAHGFAAVEKEFVSIATRLGVSARKARVAYALAVEAQKEFQDECQRAGREFLAALEHNPEEIGVVVFGRSYNAFTRQANMGIPQKFATRGYRVIPCDFLPYGGEEPYDYMYWASGQLIMKAARFVANHPRLFPVFITNFSCGPDSFLVDYFRGIMGRKPSLTLELDSHTADAGLDTRIEAFLDVVKSYLELSKNRPEEEQQPFRPARVITGKEESWVEDSRGDRYPLNHPRVRLLVPSMGDLGTRIFTAALRHVGIQAIPAPAPTVKELKIGKGYASCKECLPLILTVGTLVDYLENQKAKDEILVYFMPKTSGPCRFGQYNVLMKNVIEKMRYEDVAMISLTDENSYAGFGTKLSLRLWQAIVISDVMEEIYSGVLALATDKEKSLAVFNNVCERIMASLERDREEDILETLRWAARELNALERTRELAEAPKVALIGEIYVRRDGFSRQYLLERLAGQGIITRTAPILEWIHYCDYRVINRLSHETSFKGRLKAHLLKYFKMRYEKRIKDILAGSGFYEPHMIDVSERIASISDLIPPQLTGEAILTTAGAIKEVVEEVAGVISIGPFGCMPSRIADAVISTSINKKKMAVAKDKKLVEQVLEQYPSLPFLSVETDGNAFPQVIEARLEIFCLQVERVHRTIMALQGGGPVPEAGQRPGSGQARDQSPDRVALR